MQCCAIKNPYYIVAVANETFQISLVSKTVVDLGFSRAFGNSGNGKLKFCYSTISAIPEWVAVQHNS